MSKDKPPNIDDIKKALLPSIAELFEHHSDKTTRKFESMDKKFEAVDKKFESMDKKFEAIDKKFEALDRKFTDKIDQLGTLMEQTGKKIDVALEFTDGSPNTRLLLRTIQNE